MDLKYQLLSGGSTTGHAGKIVQKILRSYLLYFW
jgi:hypothetical protein